MACLPTAPDRSARLRDRPARLLGPAVRRRHRRDHSGALGPHGARRRRGRLRPRRELLRATIGWCAGKAAAMSLDVTVRGITIPAEELTWRFSRSPGPGGQSVNTADTRAELSFDLAATSALPPAHKQRALAALAGRLAEGVITVAASEYRSQLRNR